MISGRSQGNFSPGILKALSTDPMYLLSCFLALHFLWTLMLLFVMAEVFVSDNFLGFPWDLREAVTRPLATSLPLPPQSPEQSRPPPLTLQ